MGMPGRGGASGKTAASTAARVTRSGSPPVEANHLQAGTEAAALRAERTSLWPTQDWASCSTGRISCRGAGRRSAMSDTISARDRQTRRQQRAAALSLTSNLLLVILKVMAGVA